MKAKKIYAPANSGVMATLIKTCGQCGIDEHELKTFCYRFDAPSDLRGLIRVCTNLVEIWRSVEESIRSDETLDDARINNYLGQYDKLRTLTETARKILAERAYIESNNDDVIRDGHAGDVHVMNGYLHRNPVYAMVWVRPLALYIREQSIDEKEKKENDKKIARFRVLQGIVTQLCVELMIGNVTFDEYWIYDEKNSILGDYGTTIGHVCTQIRKLARGDNTSKIKDHDICVDLNKFINKYDQSLHADLADEYKPLKTLATKIKTKKSRLRDWYDREGNRCPKRKKDDEATEYGDSMRIAHLPSERVSTRDISTYQSSDELIEADIPAMEMMDERMTHAMVSRPCHQKNKKQQILAAIGKANNMAMSNQRLYRGISYVSAIEIKHWCQRITMARESDDANESQRLSYALMWLSVWTGIDPRIMKKVIVVDSFSDLPDEFDCGYVRNDRVLITHVDVPKTKKTKSKKFMLGGGIESNHIMIRCGDEVSDEFEILCSKKESRGTEFKPLRQVINYRANHDNLFKNVKDKSGYNITFARMKKIIYNEIAAIGDPVFAMYVTSYVDTRDLVASHYACAILSEVNSAYHIARNLIRRCCGLQDKNNNDKKLPCDYADMVVGASIPTMQDVQELFAALRLKLKVTNDKNAYHNWYTLYVSLCISFGTGYRAVRDINLGPECRVDELSVGYASDKDDSDNTRTRRVVICVLLMMQLRAYEEARRVILSAREMFVTDAIEGIKYLFFIGSDKTIEEFRPSRAEKMMAELGYHYSFNSSRKFLRRQMIKDKIPVDIVDSVMGHTFIGREPSNDYNCAITSSQIIRVRNYVDELMRLQGIDVENYRYV